MDTKDSSNSEPKVTEVTTAGEKQKSAEEKQDISAASSSKEEQKSNVSLSRLSSVI